MDLSVRPSLLSEPHLFSCRCVIGISRCNDFLKTCLKMVRPLMTINASFQENKEGHIRVAVPFWFLPWVWDLFDQISFRIFLSCLQTLLGNVLFLCVLEGNGKIDSFILPFLLCTLDSFGIQTPSLPVSNPGRYKAG